MLHFSSRAREATLTRVAGRVGQDKSTQFALSWGKPANVTAIDLGLNEGKTRYLNTYSTGSGIRPKRTCVHGFMSEEEENLLKNMRGTFLE